MLNYSANGPSGYNLTNSLRFRESAGAYLNRTPASAGNRKTWTWSGWVKLGLDATSNDRMLFSGTTNGTTTIGTLFFDGGSSRLRYIDYTTSPVSFQTNIATTPVYRDPSAWYHIVLTVDTTQATASNRFKFYVNGNQVTAFATASYPAQNTDTFINAAQQHRLGSYLYNSPNFDGYMTEINFIDGQALTPSSFGNTNSVTGVWQPAKYTGTYGTNGFYLNFTDIALTSGSNTGLGKDNSGNGNYWNTNNISVTAGTTYDAMTDVPTLTSATVANYCVLSPLAGDLTPTNGNLSVSGIDKSTLGTVGVLSGKWYFEMTCVSNVATTNNDGVGIGNCGINNNAPDKAFYIYRSGGVKLQNGGSNTSYGASFTTGDVIGVAYDADAGTLVFYKNNSSQGTAFTGITGTMLPIVYARGITSTPTLALNFGQQPFIYTPPSGYVALNTFNLPSSTIPQGNKYMDATLYTGNGGTLSVSNAAGFKPDLVWIKSRSNARDHALADSVRGVLKDVASNTTAAETTNTNYLTSFNSNGFTIGDLLKINANGNTFVAWQWQANQGTNTTNTAGSITSTTSVNATAGFSVATYTGNGTNGATVGHGLGVAPKVILLKSRSILENWAGYFAVLGNGFNINLNANTGAGGSTDWNNTTPTSTVFTIGNGSGNNQNNATYVAYCWTEIAGFSKFGSYTGNGSSNGPMVYTGFKPKYLIIKSSSIAGEWAIYDIPRDLYNPMGLGGGRLQANTSNAETGADSAQYIDFLSNGFKIRNGSGFDNDSGATYIYIAFAENPFKNSLAF